jgi:predicted membrane protein
MNDVLNAQGYTQAAWWNRIPIAAWCLMFLIAVLANLLLGYGMHRRAVVLSIILPLAVSISFLLIADIDSPRGGVILIHPQNLYALVDSLQAGSSTSNRVPNEPGAGEDH